MVSLFSTSGISPGKLFEKSEQNSIVSHNCQSFWSSLYRCNYVLIKWLITFVSHDTHTLPLLWLQLMYNDDNFLQTFKWMACYLLMRCHFVVQVNWAGRTTPSNYSRPHEICFQCSTQWTIRHSTSIRALHLSVQLKIPGGEPVIMSKNLAHLKS